MVVELIGEARVHWTKEEDVGKFEERRTETRQFSGHEMYVQQKVCLYNPPNGYLPAGRYDMPFTLQLPYNAPSSFVGHHGTVMYKVVYNVHRPWKMAKKKVMGLSVCSVSDLNKVPKARNSIAVTNEKTFGILMFKSKPLSMEINVNKTGFVPGETIYINGFIDNKSNTKIKHCEVKLFQKVEYKASSSSITGGGILHSGGATNSARKLIQELQQPGLEPKSSEKWVNLAFHIPSAPPTGLDGCSIINLSYQMQIRVVPPGMHFSLDKDFPVFIGNIPLRDIAMPGQPQTGYPQQMPGQGSAGYSPQPMPGQGGAGYPPQQMPGQGGAGFPPQQMPGQGGAGYPLQQMPGQDGAGYPPQQMPGQGGAGYPPQQKPGHGGAGYPPQQMPGQGGAGYPPQQMPGQGGAGYPLQQMPGQGGAGYPPQQMPGPGGAGYPPQQMPGQGGTWHMIMGAPPSYDRQFKVQTHKQEDHEDYEFLPQYPTYEFSKDKNGE